MRVETLKVKSLLQTKTIGLMSILCAVNHSQSEFECVHLFQMLRI